MPQANTHKNSKKERRSLPGNRYQSNPALRFALQDFIDTIPVKPYYSNNLKYGLRIGKNYYAKYIQANHPWVTHWVVIDVDSATAEADLFYSLEPIPPPNIAVINPETNHGQYFYKLKTPVITSKNGAKHPKEYLKFIRNRLVQVIPGADPNYHSPISRNPLFEGYRIHTKRSAPWSMEELLEWARDTSASTTKPRKEKSSNQSPVFSRNCSLFDKIRGIAYSQVGNFSSLDDFYVFCISEGEKHNTFETPLKLNEIEGIAKSVSKWVWSNKKTLSGQNGKNHFYSEKGRKGGIKSGIVRREKSKRKKQLAIDLRNKKYSLREISIKLKVSSSTVSRWLETKTNLLSDNSGSSVQNINNVVTKSKNEQLREAGVRVEKCPTKHIKITAALASGFQEAGDPSVSVPDNIQVCVGSSERILGNNSLLERSGQRQSISSGIVSIGENNFIGICGGLLYKQTVGEEPMSREKNGIVVYEFEKQVKNSQQSIILNDLNVIRQAFPQASHVVSFEHEMAAQVKGIDLVVLMQDGEKKHSVDKKERFTNENGKCYTDIALEMYACFSPNGNLISRKDLEREKEALSKKLSQLQSVFKTELLKTESFGLTLLAMNSYAKGQKMNIVVAPGWATKSKEIRTVDSTLYAIAPKGLGYMLPEKSMQKIVQEEFKTLLSKVHFLPPTITEKKIPETGLFQIWGVVNMAIEPETLRNYMSIPSIKFERYDIKQIDSKSPSIVLEENKSSSVMVVER
jgi:predicted transcriptional regulator